MILILLHWKNGKKWGRKRLLLKLMGKLSYWLLLVKLKIKELIVVIFGMLV